MVEGQPCSSRGNLCKDIDAALLTDPAFREDIALSIAEALVVNPAERITVDTGTLVSLCEGTYQGPPVYGVVAHTPIAMDIAIEDGLVSAAEAVYLP